MTELLNLSDNELINKIIQTNLTRVPSDLFSDSEILLQIFIKPLTPAELSAYFKNILSLIVVSSEKKPGLISDNPMQGNIRNEFIYRAVLSVNRLDTIANSTEVSCNTDTYIRILDRNASDPIGSVFRRTIIWYPDNGNS